MDKLRVLLFAMTGFGNDVFRELYNNPHCDLIGVVTPTKPSEPFPYYPCEPLHDEVLAKGIPLYEGLDFKRDEDCESVLSLSPEIIIVATFNQKLPEVIINTPIYGTINLHPSLLPAYRGATPTVWAIYNGERQTGVTAHFMTKDFDEGDIILQRIIDIDINDTDGTLRKRLSVLAGEMTNEILRTIVNGSIKRQSQDSSRATYFPKRSSSPMEINVLSSDAPISLHNKIRSHLPFPGVQILHRGGYKTIDKSVFKEGITEIQCHGGCLMYRGSKITLRPFERSDIETYRQWVNKDELATLIDRVLPVTEIAHSKWYEVLQADPKAVVFAIEVNESADYVGNVWLWNVDYRHRKAEVRILIGDTNNIGKGIGTEALKMIAQFAFNRMNLHKLYAYVLSSNERAKRAFEKAGFTVEGLLRQDRFVNGRYEDVYLMGLIKQG